MLKKRLLFLFHSSTNLFICKSTSKMVRAFFKHLLCTEDQTKSFG